MASSSRSEAVARLGELGLIDGSQYLVDGLLHQTVYYCRYSQQAHLAIVLGYFYPFHWVRTVRTVHQGTDEFILIGQEPWEQLLARHLVDTTTAFVSHNSLVGSVEICRTKDLLEKVFLVDGTSTMLSSHIHMKVCTPTYPSDSVLSFCGQPLTSANVFCILSFIRYVSNTIV